MKRRFIIAYILLTFYHLNAQKAPLIIDSCCLSAPRDLVLFTTYLEDKGFKINDLTSKPFEILDPFKLHRLKSNTTYWFRFAIKNIKPIIKVLILTFLSQLICLIE